MPTFSSADEVYERLGGVLRGALADETLKARLREPDAVVQFRHREPDATITVDLRAAGDGQVDCGETKLDPEVVLAMDADTAHRFFMGEVDLTAALARGDIRSKGPVTKVLRVLPLAKEVAPRYAAGPDQAPAPADEAAPAADDAPAETPEEGGGEDLANAG